MPDALGSAGASGMVREDATFEELLQAAQRAALALRALQKSAGFITNTGITRS
jgi:hypothetical protein